MRRYKNSILNRIFTPTEKEKNDLSDALNDDNCDRSRIRDAFSWRLRLMMIPYGLLTVAFGDDTLKRILFRLATLEYLEDRFHIDLDYLKHDHIGLLRKKPLPQYFRRSKKWPFNRDWTPYGEALYLSKHYGFPKSKIEKAIEEGLPRSAELTDYMDERLQ